MMSFPRGILALFRITVIFIISQQARSDRKWFRRLLDHEVLYDMGQYLRLNHGFRRAAFFHLLRGDRQGETVLGGGSCGRGLGRSGARDGSRCRMEGVEGAIQAARGWFHVSEEGVLVLELGS